MLHCSVKPFSQIPFSPTLSNSGLEKPISSPSGMGGLMQCANGSTNIGSNVFQMATPNNGHTGNNSVIIFFQIIHGLYSNYNSYIKHIIYIYIYIHFKTMNILYYRWHLHGKVDQSALTSCDSWSIQLTLSNRGMPTIAIISISLSTLEAQYLSMTHNLSQLTSDKFKTNSQKRREALKNFMRKGLMMHSSLSNSGLISIQIFQMKQGHITMSQLRKSKYSNDKY